MSSPITHDDFKRRRENVLIIVVSIFKELVTEDKKKKFKNETINHIAAIDNRTKETKK